MINNLERGEILVLSGHWIGKSDIQINALAKITDC